MSTRKLYSRRDEIIPMEKWVVIRGRARTGLPLLVDRVPTCEAKRLVAPGTHLPHGLADMLNIRRESGLYASRSKFDCLSEQRTYTQLTMSAKKSAFFLGTDLPHSFGHGQDPSLSWVYKLKRKLCSLPSGHPFIHCPCVISLTSCLISAIYTLSGSSSTSMTSSLRSFEKKMPGGRSNESFRGSAYWSVCIERTGVRICVAGLSRSLGFLLVVRVVVDEPAIYIIPPESVNRMLPSSHAYRHHHRPRHLPSRHPHPRLRPPPDQVSTRQPIHVIADEAST